MVEALVKDLEIYEEDTTKDRSFTISTGKAAYGMEIKYVAKITGLHEMIKIPGLHNNIRGIINFNDRIIPVIDIQIRFNKELKAYSDRTYILIIEIKKILVGIIVDNANEVINMDIVVNYLVMMNLIKLE